MEKQFILKEEEYYSLCNELEYVHCDIHRALNKLDDKEQLKKLLLKSHKATNKILKDLKWA